MKKKYKNAYKLLINFSEVFEMMFVRENSDYLLEVSQIMKKRCEDILGDEDFFFDEDVSIIDSISIARDFLLSIDEKYLKDFDTLLCDGTFNIFDLENEEESAGFSDEAYFGHDFETGKFDINIPATYSIEDVFVLIHEYFHKTNTSVETSFDRDLFTEAVSIAFEFILYDYLIQNGLSNLEARSAILYRIEDIAEKADLMIDYCKTSKYYDKNISKFKITSVNIDDDKLEEWMDNFVDDVHYFIAGLIAVYVYYSYKNNKLTPKMLCTFSEKLNSSDELESIKILFDDFPSSEDLTSSFDLLEDELSLNNQRVMKK